MIYFFPKTEESQKHGFQGLAHSMHTLCKDRRIDDRCMTARIVHQVFSLDQLPNKVFTQSEADWTSLET